MMFNFSKRSETNLKGVHPDLVKVARRALQLTSVDFMVTQGRRTPQEQKNLVMAGKSQTMNSRHLTGHAIDVAALYGGVVTWDWNYYVRIAEAFKKAARELNIPIEWGGDWKTLKDGPHFQLTKSAYPDE